MREHWMNLLRAGRRIQDRLQMGGVYACSNAMDGVFLSDLCAHLLLQ